MKKAILTTILLPFVAMTAEASYLEGLWCDFQIDFNTVLQIESDDTFTQYVLGATSNELHGHEKGYFSLGASEHHMYIGDKDFDLALEEARVEENFFGPKKLILSFDDGSRRVYQQCRVKKND